MGTGAAIWVGIIGILVGVISSLIGQAFWWGRFEGRVLVRIDGNDQAISELKKSRSEMWVALNSHGERIARVEAKCDIRHSQGQNRITDREVED